jgi:small subunit ribosomal protein S15
MLTQDQKTTITREYRVHETDTGSAEVQVAMLTRRILQLTDHLRANKHDYGTRRSLLKLVGRRRRQLSYLNKTDVGRYRTLIASLGLRR